jgi:hypothetical protein
MEPYEELSRIQYPVPERHRCAYCGKRRVCTGSDSLDGERWVCRQCCPWIVTGYDVALMETYLRKA